MEKTTGTVRSFIAHAGGERAIIDVDVAAVCSRCAAGKGCGAGILGGSGRVRQVAATIGTGVRLGVGDRVEIALRPRDLLQAAVVVYVPPLLGAAIAATAAYGIVGRDIDAAAAALIGMALGLFASRYYLNHTTCLERVTPVVERRLPARMQVS